MGITAVGGTAWADEEPGVVRISVSSTGGEGNAASGQPFISADGRVAAFRSSSVNLIPGDYTGGIFVKDLATGALTKIASGYSPTLSGDGRYVAFMSSASTLVAGDTNKVADIFVHDRETGVTKRVSVASDGTEANAKSVSVMIAAGGRYVVFTSLATNLAPGATGAYEKVFVHDLETGTTTEASVDNNGGSAKKLSTFPTISADGHLVAFTSADYNLLPGGTLINNYNSVYVRDLQSGTTRRLTSSFVYGGAAISADGRFVSYFDSKSDILPGGADTNRVTDVFRWDLADDSVIRVNVANDGTQADKASGLGNESTSISADGRYVIFESAATNLVDGDTNGGRDIFLRDTVAGTTTRVSPDGTGASATAGNYYPSINGDGSAVVFHSELALVAEDINAAPDIYLWRAASPESPES